MTWQPSVKACDSYLQQRTGHYGYRRIRYNAAADFLKQNGLSDNDIIMDIGAGWTEFDYFIRVEHDWKGRYVPIDGWIDNTDLEFWKPPREVEWFVALEIIEHLEEPYRLVLQMQASASKGVVISTPNPETVDVISMDYTHKTEIWAQNLVNLGFKVESREFYGTPDDSLFATWVNV